MNRRELLLAGASLAACSPATSQAPASVFPMRRGVNLGNGLDAPNEGDWGYRIEAAHLDAIAEAGFDGLRLPVRWDQHMDARGHVAAAHMARVEEVVGWALARGLKVQLDVHHYAALIEHPRHETRRFHALWRQIAERFADAPSALLFEPLNEPHGAQWDGAQLTDLQSSVLETIRASNPERVVVLGPGNWQNIDALTRWRPPDDNNIAVSVHYYEPHAFTHQNAEWLGADAPRYPRDWGSHGDRDLIVRHIYRAVDWAAARGLPLQLGEFGVNRRVAPAQRALWTRVVRVVCERARIGWCAWDFAGAFGIWDRDTNTFIPEMQEALRVDCRTTATGCP